MVPHKTDAAFAHAPRIFLREIRLNNDSIYFGSHFSENGQMQANHFDAEAVYESGLQSISFAFSCDKIAWIVKNEYRYQLEGYDRDWSSWDTQTMQMYANLPTGRYRLRIQARDCFGREREEQTFSFRILPPFYLKWYSITLYVLALSGLFLFVFKWRMHKLLKEKEMLEQIVAQRTHQLVAPKNEIEEKSKKLEKALKDLNQAQDDLVRQEKMATIGKLTQGLIDRILNPLNYINNFSHLTSGLVLDLRKNIKEEQRHLDSSTYEDSLDILDMMASNLSKIEKHGSNTTRILKVMEEMIKERSKQSAPIELVSLCPKDIELLKTYYEKDINQMHISILTHYDDKSIMIRGNAEQLSKTLMSLLNNGMYALIRKRKKQSFTPQISLYVTYTTHQAIIRLRDNGIGIEPSILEKIFDPFFTTKTTGEAAGVGLYLSREIIVNHHGLITVDSQKDEYTQFVISLPLLRTHAND